jgi:hypothetical protein
LEDDGGGVVGVGCGGFLRGVGYVERCIWVEELVEGFRAEVCTGLDPSYVGSF